ncbi:hypothetical protein TrispH2_011610 [Trichoplax sp. H2]|nr:hypothetical protein TrispH2_011610 [Trichoplax sp. H2]|eukprot:RDD36471.1 hypothetical protein TrispH2_011610 [Trichoplax sp. H2]
MANKLLNDNLSSKLDQADNYYDNGNYSDAIKYYSDVNKDAKHYIKFVCIDDEDNTRFTCRSWIGLMKSKFQLHQLDEVKKDFEDKMSHFAKTSLSSLLAEAWYIIGNVRIKNEKYDKALSHFEAAMEFLNSSETNDLLTLIQYGRVSVYMLQYEYDKARSVILKSVTEQLRSMQNSIEKTTENSECLNVLNSVTEHLQYIQKSIEKTTENLTLLTLPSNRSLLNTDNFYDLLNKIESSLPLDMKKTVKLALFHDTIGNLFYMLGYYRGAIDYFMKSYNIKKERFKPRSWHRMNSAIYLANAYFASDQLDNARKYFRLVLRKINKDTKYKDHQLFAKISNILGEIAFRTRKANPKNDKDYNYFRASTDYFKKASKVDKEKNGVKFELSKAHYGIGKAYLEQSNFKTAARHLEKSKEILNGISNNRRLLIADIRDQIAELYERCENLDASKKEYMESLKFRKAICDEYNIDFVRSYYGETKWEKYIRRNDRILTLGGSCLIDIKKKKLYEEIDTAYHKLRKIYGLLSGHPYSLHNRENAGNYGNSFNGQYIKDFPWLKDEIDKIAKVIEGPLDRNKVTDGEVNVGIPSNNSSDQPDDNYQKTATSKTFVPISQKQDVMHRSISYIDLSDSFPDFEFDDNEDQILSSDELFHSRQERQTSNVLHESTATVEKGERIANEKLLTSKVTTDTARLSESRSELAPPNASNKNLNASEPEINGLNSIKTGHSQSKLSEPKTTARKFVSMKNRDESSVLTIARTAIKEFQEAYETAFDGGECLNNFANIMLIGPNHDGKSFIYKSLTKQPESSSNGAPVLINLDSIKQASNSDEKIIFDIQSFIDSKVLSVIEKQGNISRNSELQRIFFTALEKGNDQPSDKSRITVPSSDKVPVDNIDIGYHLNNNDNEITRTSDNDNNIISLLKETAKHLSSPSFSRCFQKFYQRSKYYHDNRFAKIWNFDNHSYYQPFKFQQNVYIAPFDVSFKQDKIDIDDYSAGLHDYITSFQEWMINAIDWNTNENQLNLDYDSQEGEIPLPIILFVAFNSNDKLTEEAQSIRRSDFMDKLDMKMPQYKSHFLSSQIIINTVGGNQSKDLEETDYRSSWDELCEEIQKYVLEIPFFKQKVKLKWYLMAELLRNPIPVPDTTVGHTLDGESSTGMQYIQTLEQVYAKAGNRMKPIEVMNVMKFLHEMGEILFSEHSEADSLIVTQINWLYDNFRRISTLVDNYKQRHFASNVKSREYCKWAKDYGIVTKASVKCAMRQKAFVEEDVHFLLQVMERNRLIYKSSRNLEKIKAGTKEQYFFPNLLSSRQTVTGNEFRYEFQSSWLYLGFDKNSHLCITDHIFHQFLLSCQSELDVELHYHSAKYSSKQNYDIIVEKSGSHIRIQYCYESVDESKENDQIAMEEISEISSNDQLRVHFKSLLSKIVKDAHPEQQEIDCEYFFPCLKCDQLIPCPSNIVAQIIKCANTKCRTKNKLADMKGWNSVLFSSSLPCNDIKSIPLNQDITSPGLSTVSTCDEEDVVKSSADSVKKKPNTYYHSNSNSTSRKRKTSEMDEHEGYRESESYTDIKEVSNDFDNEKSNGEEFSLQNRIGNKRKREQDTVNGPKKRSLSVGIQKALDLYHEEFMNVVPIEDLWTNLTSQRILTTSTVGKWKSSASTKEQNDKLWNVLRYQRRDKDFFTFCNMLKDHDVEAIAEFGEYLEKLGEN